MPLPNIFMLLLTNFCIAPLGYGHPVKNYYAWQYQNRQSTTGKHFDNFDGFSLKQTKEIFPQPEPGTAIDVLLFDDLHSYYFDGPVKLLNYNTQHNFFRLDASR